MGKLTYEGPSGEVLYNPDLELIKRAILEFREEYWMVGAGGATLHWEGSELNSTLLVLPNLSHGFYLQYSETVAGKTETWLSLRDPAKLSEVAECSDEWYASVGLFLRPEDAWPAVQSFCTTGGKAPSIPWISPDEIPEDGNW